uniref:Uncharacterized protein n=1 Tax=Anguilla anguilla TaxID=7936 RepID=A0A0E9UB47_ANGAN
MRLPNLFIIFEMRK